MFNNVYYKIVQYAFYIIELTLLPLLKKLTLNNKENN